MKPGLLLILFALIFLLNSSFGQSRYPHKIILYAQYGGNIYKAKIISIQDGVVICEIKGLGRRELKLETIKEIYEVLPYPKGFSVSALIGQIEIIEKPALGLYGLKISWEPHPNWSFGICTRYEYYYRYFLNDVDTFYKSLNIVSPLLEIKWYPWYSSHKVKFGFFLDGGYAFSSTDIKHFSINRYNYIGVSGISLKTYLSERLLLNSDVGFRAQFPEDPYRSPSSRDFSNSHGFEFRIGISYQYYSYPK
ncbi:MAG TPA: hypothetical protein VI757_10530 [Bacteroidia bacterium]|nr:hypothetical protein [Bacteroidia bacterium]